MIGISSRFSRRRALRLGALGCQIAIAVGVGCLGACKSKGAKAHPSPIPSMSNGIAFGVPVLASSIEAALNPEHLEPYDGPYGIVEGTVKVDGGPMPETGLNPPPDTCPEAAVAYARTGRVDAKGMLGDALVTVTGYHAFVPPPSHAVEVTIKGCAYDRRLYDVTFGQPIDVRDLDDKPYLPHLEGARADALRVTLPHGAPIRISPLEPRPMVLVEDMLHPWMVAPVFVLKYPTHTTTTLDGHFRIENVPVGHVAVNAFHPGLSTVPKREVDVKAGEVTKVDFVIPFVPEHDAVKRSPPPPPSGSAPSAVH